MFIFRILAKHIFCFFLGHQNEWKSFYEPAIWRSNPGFESDMKFENSELQEQSNSDDADNKYSASNSV